MAINIEKKIHKSILELKNFNIMESPFVHVWDNNLVTRSRNHLLYTKNKKYVDYLTRTEKNCLFFTYRAGTMFSSRTNIFPIDYIEEMNTYSKYTKINKLGFVFLDVERSIESKKILMMIKDYVDEDTIFYCPIFINFDDYDMRAIYGVMEFCVDQRLNIKWICTNGSPRLYDHVDKGFNHAACFRLV